MINYQCCIPGLTESPNRVLIHQWFQNIHPIYDWTNEKKPKLTNFQGFYSNPYDTWWELPAGDTGIWNFNQSTTLTRDLTITGQWSHIADDYYQWPSDPQTRWFVTVEVGDTLWIGGWELGLLSTFETDVYGSSNIQFSGSTQYGFIRCGNRLRDFILDHIVCDTLCGPYLCENTNSDVRLFTINDCLVIDFMNAICD